ncbi:MAG: glycosyltransferase [Anaerolineaceae bacterium]|nr:glycosyltransferase [Anaerolineaceae bacterium]
MQFDNFSDTDPMVRISILDVPVDAQRFDAAITCLARWATEPQPRYVVTCAVYTLMQGRQNPAIQKAIEQADMITADGMPLVWLQRRLGYPPAERVYGPDIMTELCRATANGSASHYFYGGRGDIAERVATKWQHEFPGLHIAGTEAPPDNLLMDAPPDPAVVQRLNESGADIIWVGLGSPKQDLWMARYRPVLNASLLIGVGAAFDFFSGRVSQAPRWIQHSGFEWLFRLTQEPTRLWRRYLVYNPWFMWLVLRHHILK